MTRYPRVLENLGLAMLRLPLVLVYDNGFKWGVVWPGTDDWAGGTTGVLA